MHLSFTGILQVSLDDSEVPDVPVPEGMALIEALHITLLSSSIKPHRKAFKKAFKAVRDSLPPFPGVTFGEPYIADNGEKRSMVCDVIEQARVHEWVTECVLRCADVDETIADVEPESDRVYHVSVANTTGSRFDSVADPWNHRKGGAS